MRTRSRTMICQCDAGYTESRALVGARPIDWGRNQLKLKSKDKPTRGKGRWAAWRPCAFRTHICTRLDGYNHTEIDC